MLRSVPLKSFYTGFRTKARSFSGKAQFGEWLMGRGGVHQSGWWAPFLHSISENVVVSYFHRQAGRPDNGNYLESWELRGNLLSSTFPGFLLVFRGKNLYIGNYGFLYANKSCTIKRGIASTPQYQSLKHKSAKEA